VNILIVEDELLLANFIKKGLTEKGYKVSIAYDGRTGKNLALEQDFDLVILDAMLPIFNGFEVCKFIKGHHKTVPVLMLTALVSISDKVEGFGSGADDYLTKPFHFDELIARIKALTRNQKATIKSKIYIIDNLILDTSKKSVSRDGKEIFLTTKEYSLLKLLMINRDTILSRAHIAESVWGSNFSGETNIIDVYINYLRAKIDKGFSKKLIHTVVGMGYVLKD